MKRSTRLVVSAGIALALGTMLVAGQAGAAGNTLFRGKLIGDTFSSPPNGELPNPAIVTANQWMWGTAQAKGTPKGTLLATVGAGAFPQSIKHAGGEKYATSYINPNPNTQAGVVFQNDKIQMTGLGGTVAQGAGLGAITFAATGGVPLPPLSKSPGVYPTPKTGSFTIIPSAKTFGGSLKYVENYFGKVAFLTPTGGGQLIGTNVNLFNWGTTASPKISAASGKFKHNKLPLTLTNVNQISAFGFTAGTIVAHDKNIKTGSVAGFDSRTTAMGQVGLLQLVSPAMINVRGLGPGFTLTAYGALKMDFLPEPAGTAGLAAGLGGLGLLFGLDVMRRRRLARSSA